MQMRDHPSVEDLATLAHILRLKKSRARIQQLGLAIVEQDKKLQATNEKMGAITNVMRKVREAFTFRKENVKPLVSLQEGVALPSNNKANLRLVHNKDG